MKLVGAALLIVAGMLCMSTVAFAAYSGDGGVTVSPTSVHAGDSIKVESTGWKPSSSVTITLHSDPVVLDTVNSDDSGAVSATATIPSDTAAGSHTIELTGVGTDSAARTTSTPITVTTGGGGSLPRTGAAIAALAFVGLVLFGGGSLMSAARRRATR
jgi:LPXTG-motif cell wall-anchored protein